MNYDHTMARHKEAPSAELARLISRAGEDAGSLVSAYEPIEDAYRDAVAWNGSVTEVVNTSTVPQALITTGTSAR